jgi:hypothetical protein
VKHGKIAARHSDMVLWFKSNMKLGHVHASFIAAYIRLRAKDPAIGAKTRKWAYGTGYRGL